MKQEQLIASIEQQLENLMTFDSELELEYELALYDEDGEPIVDLFTEERVPILRTNDLSLPRPYSTRTESP